MTRCPIGLEEELAGARSFLTPMVADRRVRMANRALRLTEVVRPCLPSLSVLFHDRLRARQPDRRRVSDIL